MSLDGYMNQLKRQLNYPDNSNPGLPEPQQPLNPQGMQIAEGVELRPIPADFFGGLDRKQSLFPRKQQPGLNNIQGTLFKLFPRVFLGLNMDLFNNCPPFCKRGGYS